MNARPLHRQLQSLAADETGIDQFCEQAVKYIKDSNDKFDWVGIYLAHENRLHLPSNYFQGPDPDHKEISFSEGICGASASEKSTITVDDVNSDPRYLACSIHTRSEIVVPIIYNDELLGVLDLDSDAPAAFGKEERTALEDAARVIGEYLGRNS